MPLTRAHEDGADDLGSALAQRFGSPAPSKAVEGDDLLPGGDLVEELRSQVELLEAMAARAMAPPPAPLPATAVPPLPSSPAPADPLAPTGPALSAEELAALAPPPPPAPSA